MENTDLRPGVLGLETLITSTSAYGANVLTPATKSLIESGGELLFLPKFTANRFPGRRDAGVSPPTEAEGSLFPVVVVAEENAGIRARRRFKTAM